jgi:cytochrome c-type biogenesis protein CcmE
MQNKVLKIGLTMTVLVAAFAGLMWTTMAEGTAYYQHVDEVMVDPEVWYGKRLQVHGYAQDIRVRPKSMDYHFDIENNGYVVTAEYTGIVPDTFQNDAEVVVTGRLEGHTFVVEPDGIMAKCPSKYEPKPVIGSSTSGGDSAPIIGAPGAN